MPQIEISSKDKTVQIDNEVFEAIQTTDPSCCDLCDIRTVCYSQSNINPCLVFSGNADVYFKKKENP